MKEIFEQYGGAIVTVVAIMALVGVTTAIVGSGENSVIYKAMTDLISTFGEAVV